MADTNPVVATHSDDGTSAQIRIPVPRCKAGDRRLACRVAQHILRSLESHSLTLSERRSLHRKLKVWQRRAEGRDHRFNLVGNRRGRLQKDMEIILSSEVAPFAKIFVQ